MYCNPSTDDLFIEQGEEALLECNNDHMHVFVPLLNATVTTLCASVSNFWQIICISNYPEPSNSINSVTLPTFTLNKNKAPPTPQQVMGSV